MSRVGGSVVVPAFREAENLPRLIPQVAAALNSHDWLWEIIVVDDNSPDGTAKVLADLAAQWPQFRYLIRTGERGLSSAVLAGMALAQYPYILVMDADLSHPPESIPSLIDPLVEDRADFTIGSRYVAGGRTEDWGRFRWVNSAVATILSRPFARGIRDPMAGFFALPRQLYLAADWLNPIGYKIGLELIVKCRATRIVEVPIVFRNRLHGESKLTLAEQFRYLEHLSRLYDYKFPNMSPRLKFLIAAACGAAVCLALFALAAMGIGIPFMGALAIGLAGMTLVTLLFFVRYVHTQKTDISMKRPFAEFAAISAMELCVGLAAGWAVVGYCGHKAALATAIATVLVVRYAMRKLFQHDLRGMRKAAPPAHTDSL